VSELWIERLIDAQLAQHEQKDPRLVSHLREVGGLRLYLTLGSEGFLRPDGSVWIHEHENWGGAGTTEVRLARSNGDGAGHGTRTGRGEVRGSETPVA